MSILFIIFSLVGTADKESYSIHHIFTLVGNAEICFTLIGTADRILGSTQKIMLKFFVPTTISILYFSCHVSHDSSATKEMDVNDEADPPTSIVASHKDFLCDHVNAALARQQRKRALEQHQLVTQGTKEYMIITMPNNYQNINDMCYLYV
ncbi:hypothetical protein ACJX0J_018168 [Zea mays]